MTRASAGGLTPEREARREIDARLAGGGCVLQDHKHAAVAAAQGVAVREVPVGAGRADYVLFVDCQAVGVIEAKPVGTTLTGVEPQTLGYRQSYPGELPMFQVDGVLPFGYESTGVETRFTCGLDPVPTSRRVFGFHRPETLARWVVDHIEAGAGTLRAGLTLLPELEPRGLWRAQAEAVRSLEVSLRDNRQRALIQMATGAGKTFTAVNAIYRLVRHAGAQRVLFLDIFWLRDDSLTDTDDLPPPAVLAAEIAEDLQAALEEIQALAESLAAADGTNSAEFEN